MLIKWLTYSTIYEKFGFKNVTNVLVSPARSGPAAGAYNTNRICTPEKKVIKMLHRRLVHVCKTLVDMQILVCELHQNTFGGRAPPGPAGGSIALPQTPSRF